MQFFKLVALVSTLIMGGSAAAFREDKYMSIMKRVGVCTTMDLIIANLARPTGCCMLLILQEVIDSSISSHIIDDQEFLMAEHGYLRHSHPTDNPVSSSPRFIALSEDHRFFILSSLNMLQNADVPCAVSDFPWICFTTTELEFRRPYVISQCKINLADSHQSGSVFAGIDEVIAVRDFRHTFVPLLIWEYYLAGVRQVGAWYFSTGVRNQLNIDLMPTILFMLTGIPGSVACLQLALHSLLAVYKAQNFKDLLGWMSRSCVYVIVTEGVSGVFEASSQPVNLEATSVAITALVQGDTAGNCHNGRNPTATVTVDYRLRTGSPFSAGRQKLGWVMTSPEITPTDHALMSADLYAYSFKPL
ncbi:hypothetical protein C8R44DRAFT_750329 [Mycena epipterygia]|nr:hypothetical protein C8R44DRAFT_750329 [Mycena epipterygia]